MAAVQINSVYTGIAGSHISGENSRGVVALKKQEVTRVDVQRAVDTARSVAVLPSDRRILHGLPREVMGDDQEGIREPLGMSGSSLEVDVHIITRAVTPAQHIIKSIDLGRRGVVEMVDVPGVGDRPARTLSRKLLAEITEPRVEEMFDLVRREIIRTGYEGILAAGVVITGGTSMLEGILEAAERVLDLPVRRGVPNGVGGLRDIVSNPMYATGVGLILLARHHAGELELTGLRGGRRVGRALGRMRAWMLEVF